MKLNKRTSISQSAIKNVKHGLNCPSCNLLIHKKCSRLSRREILDLKKASKPRWECSTYLTIKFPFVYLSDEDIRSISFNSNFPCKCQKTLPSGINQNKCHQSKLVKLATGKIKDNLALNRARDIP